MNPKGEGNGSKLYWMINGTALFLFVLVGVILILGDQLTAFTVVAVCYGFTMFVGNTLYRSYQKQRSKVV